MSVAKMEPPVSAGNSRGAPQASAAAAAAESDEPAVQPSSGVYLCDLAPSIMEGELRQLLGQYGELVNMRQADIQPEPAVMASYSSVEAAEEAQKILNLASLRGRTCRCITVGALEVIRRTMVSGHRLIIENLDPGIAAHGLWDVCSLFGQVLDCKVQRNDDGTSRGIGFVHYAKSEDASNAQATLDKMQIGECEVKLRPFRWDDASMFTGTLYARLIYNPYIDTLPTSV